MFTRKEYFSLFEEIESSQFQEMGDLLEQSISLDTPFDDYRLRIPNKTPGLYACHGPDRNGKVRVCYVGISRDVKKRLYGHVNGSLASSTLAYLIAVDRLTKEDIPTPKSRKDIDPDQLVSAAEFLKENFHLGHIKIQDDFIMHLFELWTAKKFETLKENGGYNEFRTH